MEEWGEVRKEAIKLVQLIHGYTSEPIEWIFDIRKSRKSFVKKDISKEGKPAIHGGEIARKYGYHTNETISKVSDNIYEQSGKLYKGEIFVSSEDFEEWQIGKSLFYVGEEPVALSGTGFILKLKQGLEDIINLKYVSLCFHYSKEYEEQIQKITNGTRVKRMSEEDFKTVKLIFPAIEIQEKIVKQMDNLLKMGTNGSRINGVIQTRVKFAKEMCFNLRIKEEE